jgi:hypothetical protein
MAALFLGCGSNSINTAVYLVIYLSVCHSQVSTKPLLYRQLYMCTLSTQSCSAWPKPIWLSLKLLQLGFDRNRIIRPETRMEPDWL